MQRRAACHLPKAAAREAVANGQKEIQPNYRRRTLRLPDLDHSKLAVLNSLGHPVNDLFQQRNIALAA
jgi:hypothetical protein